MIKRIFIVIPIILALAAAAFSETIITGKVVGISDGDTITVLQDHTQYKIRLYGIDSPESHQDFGTKAKQFTSDLVFGKEVKVIKEDTDRYGRTVGIVYVGNTCVNQEIIRNGFAWVYEKYCHKPMCQEWQKLEDQARTSKAGLWSHPNPVQPWDFRRGIKKLSAAEETSTNADAAVVYHGNTGSKIFHRPGCANYTCKRCTVIFNSREEAIAAGYKPCGICKP